MLNRRFGVPLIDLGTIRLPRIVGHGRAMDLILTGRAVGAAEALAMGLVNRVVPDGEALTATLTLLAEVESTRGQEGAARAALATARAEQALYRAARTRPGSSASLASE